LESKIHQIQRMDPNHHYEQEEMKFREGDIETRIEFMYNEMDTFNDRKLVRQLLAGEIHEKASIEDIGEVLDDLIQDYYAIESVKGTIEPESLYKEYTTRDLYPFIDVATDYRRVQPSLYEDRAYISENVNENERDLQHKIIEQVDREDAESKDHSAGGLSDHEKLEIQIYSSIKKDPYYRHYIYNCLRYESEYMNAKMSDMSMAIAADNYKMRVKFDPIEVPKIDTQSIDGGFVGKLHGGRAWGAGRRKTARAIASIKPGSGKVTVNGKNFNDYFIIPQQRRNVMKPIRISGYTAVLDVEIWVKGGGWNGQSQACVPALSKAIARFDPNLRKFMEETRLVYSDGRMRERKHYGKKRARKGRVYKRR
jgi:small subunit ribosomal protein S9